MTYVHQSIFPLYPKYNESCVRCHLLFLEKDVPVGVSTPDGVWQGMVHSTCLETVDVNVQEGML